MKKFSQVSSRFGSGLSYPDSRETRLLEEDYSIGGGVTMVNTQIQHGFSQVSHDHGGKTPKNWQIKDTDLMERVCEALFLSHEVDATDIAVKVEEGEVYLDGWVDDREAKKEAERVIEALPGIKDVWNRLHLRNRRPNEGTSLAR